MTTRSTTRSAHPTTPAPTRPAATFGRWRPTVGHVRALAAPIVAIAIALLWRRPDLLVLTTPLAVVAVWSVVARPSTVPTIEDRLVHATLREGAATTWRAEVSGADGVDFVTIVFPATPWVQLRPHHGSVCEPVTDGRADPSIALRSTRWGRRIVHPVSVAAAGPWAAFESTTRTAPIGVTTMPVPATYDSTAPVRPTDGLVGHNRSTRTGDGGEFAASRPFAAGDRLRRINWPRSLRAAQLQVNSTWADQDTHVALLLDAIDDFGASGGVDGRASSLDTGVRAAGALAEHYNRAGDRVSLRVFGAPGQPAIPAGSGRASLYRLLDALSRVRPAGGRGGRYRTAERTPWPAGGAELTVMLSALVNPEALDRAVELGRHGRPVVVVDTLPDDVTVDDDPYLALAWRIRLLERRREIRRVEGVGIPVLPWRGPGSLDQFLREVVRRASAPRMRVR